MKYRILHFLVVAVICYSTVNRAFSYEVRTHAWIGEQAFMKLLGTPFADEVATLNAKGFYFLGIDVDGKCNDEADSGSQLLEGMIEEDDVCENRYRRHQWDYGARPLQHFWFPDVQYNDGLYLVGSSLEKAQLLWERAIRTYQCGGNKNVAYWYLGRVAHLLEDMASPAHTHLDNHTTALGFPDCNEDANEKWNDQINGVTMRPNHELVSASHPNASIPDLALLPAPPYAAAIPSNYDPQLIALFYDMAKVGRQFDSDDSGHGDGAQSTVDKGIHNSFFTKVTIPDLHGRTPVMFWYQQTQNGDTSGIDPIELTLGTDFEFDDYDGTEGREDRLYLYAHMRGFDEQDVLESTYDVLEVRFGPFVGRTSAFDYGGDCEEWRNRYPLVPTSVLKRNQEVLLAKAIGHIAALYQLFWKRTHNQGQAVNFFCKLQGGTADASAASAKGGKGGKVTIQTGLMGNEIDVGNAAVGDLTWEQKGTNLFRLSTGNYTYRQVNDFGVFGRVILEISGDVVLRCQYAFKPSYVRLASNAVPETRLTVFAGQAVEYRVIPDGAGGFFELPPRDTFHSGQITLVPSYPPPNGDGIDGVEFVFKTTQISDIRSLLIDVSGGAGVNGGCGGDGGRIDLLANASGIAGTYDARGGSSSSYSANYPAGCGGNGGIIAARALRIATAFRVYADGGRGGSGATNSVPEIFGADGADGLNGGNGGNGGVIGLSIGSPVWPERVSVECFARGGQGNGGRGGGNGSPGRPGTLSLAAGGNGGKGGNGGNGGNGGAPGRIDGFEWMTNGVPTSSVTNSASGGDGGGGGRGGNGGNGGNGVNGFAGGDGGDGGNGGSGGNASDEASSPGARGFRGTAGLGGQGAPRGVAGQDGGFGTVGGTQQMQSNSESVTLPYGCCQVLTLGNLSHSFRTPMMSLSSGQFVIGMDTMAGMSNYEIQVSSDLKTWMPLTNFVSNGWLVQFTDPATNRLQRFYRARAY